MFSFDKVEKKDFEKFQTDVQDKFDSLKQEIQSKATDSEETARTAANNAVAIEEQIKVISTGIESILKELDEYKSAALSELQLIQKEKEGVLNNNKELLEKIEKTHALYAQIIKSKEKIDGAEQEIANKIQEIDSYLDQSKNFPESVASTQKLLDESKKLSESISNVLGHSVKKKSEIDDLHKEIYGEDIKDDDGNSEHVDGLKDELERSYKNIAEKADKLDSNIEKLVVEITDEHNEQFKIQRQSFEKLVSESKARIAAVNDQLTGLLPGAMAEGLSAAYEKKKDDEVQSMQKFEANFKTAIIAMVCVSLIPFCVDIYLLGVEGKDLVQVIKDTPSLIIAILPLYFPVLWLAYSSNKKLNLSKRLIEEYTHKSVLGKTFSGLSNQIETLSHQSAVKEELRTRLLFNVLQVSAENPGKLITNYNKSDHPLMEALENSAKLADSVEALSKIPGFSAIAKKLSEKSDDLLKAQIEKVENGLSTQDSLESSEERQTEGTSGADSIKF